jgi:hypothetical protein
LKVKDLHQKKQKYKERAKKYKQLLRKRDKEIMELVIQGKELKGDLDKERRRNQEMKETLKNEVSMIKDDLQQ